MIPTIVNQIIKEYIELLHHHFPNCIEGVYVHGSIALNAFEDSSDLDFLTVVKRSVKDDEIHILAQIHQGIANKYPKPQMDGMYLKWSDVGKREGITPIPYYNDGVMHPSGFFNQSPVTWWTIKHYGIRIIGPEIEKFQLDANAEDLVEYVHANMNSYWKNRVEKFKRIDFSEIPNEVIDKEIEWSVLGVLRQFYTIREHDIISKLDAGRYALKLFPTQWSKITKEAIRIREMSDVSEYESNEERISDAIEFLTHLIEHCNDLVKG